MISKDLTVLSTIYGPWLRQIAQGEVNQAIACTMLESLEEITGRVARTEEGLLLQVNAITRKVDEMMAGSEDRAHAAMTAAPAPRAANPSQNVIAFPPHRGTPV